MSSIYYDKILKEINKVPEKKIPKLYTFIHLLTTELSIKNQNNNNRGSLKGIWKGSRIDDSLFAQAKKSLFNYQ